MFIVSRKVYENWETGDSSQKMFNADAQDTRINNCTGPCIGL